MGESKKIIYFTNIFPSYRKELWKNLISSSKIDFHIYFSNDNYMGIGSSSLTLGFTLKEIKKLHLIKNRTIGGFLWWQKGILKVLFREDYDTVIFLGDMKIVSNWVGILICKLKGKKICFWSHGIYGNEKGFKKNIRLFFLSLADDLLLYENKAKNLLIQNRFSKDHLHVIYNSINLKEQTKVYQKLLKIKKHVKKQKFHNLIFFGRLTKVKKVELLIPTLFKLNQNKVKYILKIFGEGPEKQYLKLLIKHYQAEEYILLEKETFVEEEIGKLFFDSDMLVSPGNVGLNAVHALCYGTPVLTHNNFRNQMPEHEVIEENRNGCFHLENDIDNIAEKIEDWFKNQHQGYSREKARKALIKNYNPDTQVRIFEEILK